MLGSPPLTRGKALLCFFLGFRLGITPAYAGKSRVAWVPASVVRDHPRLRGEKVDWFDICGFDVGSPPLTRGKAMADLALSAVSRITPAYAGKRRFPN